MTLDQLIALDTSAIDNHFGESLAEQIVECQDASTLLALSAFLDLRLRDLISTDLPEISESFAGQLFQ